VHALGETFLRLEDEDEIIEFSFRFLGGGGYGEGVVVEEGDTRDADENMLTGFPAEGGRDGQLHTFIAESSEVDLLSVEGSEEVSTEE
jgi:hypothetical protein